MLYTEVHVRPEPYATTVNRRPSEQVGHLILWEHDDEAAGLDYLSGGLLSAALRRLLKATRVIPYDISLAICQPTSIATEDTHHLVTMPEHKALCILEKQTPFVVKSVPTYKPGPGELLIKVESTGLAPVDWAIQAFGIIIEKYPTIVGEDIAGTVEEVGEGVTRFKKGDRV